LSGEPFPKSKQLARGSHKYRRKVASPKQWQAIQAAKLGPCRVCVRPASNGGVSPNRIGRYPVCFHHIVPRDFHGDDVADNVAPLCFDCHTLVTAREPEACRALCASLTDAEYAHFIGRLGEDGFERVYGVTYARA
jgi:HNH endonuclease